MQLQSVDVGGSLPCSALNRVRWATNRAGLSDFLQSHLVEEIAELRATLMRIEYKPAAPGTPEVAETAPAERTAAPQPDAPAASNQASVTGRSGQSAHAQSVRTFGDLLSSWEQ